VAPAVVNTLLRRPERASLARRFYAERAHDLFARFARVSRDFYAQAARHHGGSFWQERAAWPAPEARAGVAADLAIAARPVVSEGWIEEREVVITPERPLGTWRVAGVELAPLVRALGASDSPRAALDVRVLEALPAVSREPVRSWLLAHLAPPARPNQLRKRRSTPR
jgi:hypothetical protein